MEIKLTYQERENLLREHKKERDKRICDRIKTVLAYDDGYSYDEIAKILLLDSGTIRRHLNDYYSKRKLKPENGGSKGKLTDAESSMLEHHLETSLYTKASDICQYVLHNFQKHYTVSGMTKWLHTHNFTFKQPKEFPAKADSDKQREFIAQYSELKEQAGADEPILFIDSTHPTMATKISCGWIRKGTDKPIKQIASRTRINISGAIELNNLNLIHNTYETINGETTIEFFKQIKAAYKSANKIHIILDQSGYHRSSVVQEFASSNRIYLHYLPPYSPNLNPIERLWKVMNEEVRNNVLFSSVKEFRRKITGFFEVGFLQIKDRLFDRINDNFHINNFASSS